MRKCCPRTIEIYVNFLNSQTLRRTECHTHTHTHARHHTISYRVYGSKSVKRILGNSTTATATAESETQDTRYSIDKTISLIFIIMCALRIHANECKRITATLECNSMQQLLCNAVCSAYKAFREMYSSIGRYVAHVTPSYRSGTAKWLILDTTQVDCRALQTE